MPNTLHDSRGEEDNCRVALDRDAVVVDLVYPNVAGNRLQAVEVNIDTVRASDGVRIVYDFERDGWSVMQPKTPDEDDPQWTETAFLQSWALEDAGGSAD